MAAHWAPNGAVIRAVTVIALATIVVVAGCFDLRRIWMPLGDLGNLGYTTDDRGVVTSVDHGSAAAAAGVAVGDKLDVRSTPPQFRYDVYFGGTGEAGQRVSIAFIHRGASRIVTLTSTPEHLDPSFAEYAIVISGIGVLWVVLGVALVLLKPSMTTWGFFLYCLQGNPFYFEVARVALPFPWQFVSHVLLNSFVGNAGLVGLIVFAMCFLNEAVHGWRAAALRFTPWLFGALFLFSLFHLFWAGWIGYSGLLLAQIFLFVQALLSLFTMYLFLRTYVEARGTDKQRLRWIVVVFGLYLIDDFGYQLLATYVPSIPGWFFNLQLVLQVAVPITIAYAVIKHRVIDVSFVLSRALVYTVMTTLLVGVLSIIDWFFMQKLQFIRLGTIAEVVAAVAMGFWFNGLHKRTDLLVDATFFRQRHKAERQLAQDAMALPLAPTTSAVAHFLVSEPVQALSLASAALFRRGQDGVFLREHSEGWHTSDLLRLDDQDDPLLMLAQNEGAPLSIDGRWRTEAIPAGAARPVLALPIIFRRELAAIVFYGSHLHGEALDPDEIRAIGGLATGAAAAYDHLEAETAKREVDSLKSKIEVLEARLAEARI